MKIPILRNRMKLDNKRLRRARRLYAYLIHKECLRNPDKTFVCAQRALARGLYAKSTSLSHVVFSLVRHFWKLTSDDTKFYYSWHQWLKENDHADWYAVSSRAWKNSKNGKPVLRVVA